MTNDDRDYDSNVGSNDHNERDRNIEMENSTETPHGAESTDPENDQSEEKDEKEEMEIVFAIPPPSTPLPIHDGEGTSRDKGGAGTTSSVGTRTTFRSNARGREVGAISTNDGVEDPPLENQRAVVVERQAKEAEEDLQQGSDAAVETRRSLKANNASRNQTAATGSTDDEKSDKNDEQRSNPANEDAPLNVVRKTKMVQQKEQKQDDNNEVLLSAGPTPDMHLDKKRSEDENQMIVLNINNIDLVSAREPPTLSTPNNPEVEDNMLQRDTARNAAPERAVSLPGAWSVERTPSTVLLVPPLLERGEEITRRPHEQPISEHESTDHLEDGTTPVATLVNEVEEDQAFQNLQQAKEHQQRQYMLLFFNTRFLATLAIVVLVALGVVVAVIVIKQQRNNKDVLFTLAPTVAPTLRPTTAEFAQFRTRLVSHIDPQALAYSPVAFAQAVEWYFFVDEYQHDQSGAESEAEDLFVQRFILIWFWMHSTNNGERPWRTCNPPRLEFMETNNCLLDIFMNTNFESREDGYIAVNATRYMSPSILECQWAYVTCTDDGTRVTGLNFFASGVTGPFPVFLSELSSLQVLNLDGNKLSGSLPKEVKLLQNLRVLEVSEAHLMGTIPEELYELTNLEVLTLFNNLLSGTISTKIGQMQGLIRLDIGNGFLTGTFPTEFGQLEHLERFLAFQQSFSAQTLPSEFGNITTLKEFSMVLVEFVGTIPASFANLTNLEVFEIASSRLTGTIPNLLAPKLWFFELPDNLLEGTIPESLFQTNTRLHVFVLSNNMLNGTISESISKLEVLTDLFVEDNLLTGSIPQALGNITSLEVVHLFNNHFEGSVPLELCELFPNGGFLEVLFADCLGLIPQNECFCCTGCCDAAGRRCVDSLEEEEEEEEDEDDSDQDR